MFGTGAATIITSMNGWTGSIFLSLLIIVIALVVLGMAFPLPLEWTSILIVPMLLVFMSSDAVFYPAGAVFLLYLAFIMGMNFMRR